MLSDSPISMGDSKKHARPAKSTHTPTKSASPLHDHHSPIHDGRHKRVWKACERCRTKKTKCDGESPCKRCKDDGIVCTAGSRKKTEHKQFPSGYAEVLETNVYALSHTVQKLYSMISRHEEWQLGDPGLNDNGHPSVHGIAQRLGCIRPSPDSPDAPALSLDQDLSAYLAIKSEEGGPTVGVGRKMSDDSVASLTRASSEESEPDMEEDDMDFGVSDLGVPEYSQQMAQQQQEQAFTQLNFPMATRMEPAFEEDMTMYNQYPRNFALDSPDFQYAQSPTLSTPDTGSYSPFNHLALVDECMSPASMLSLTGQHLQGRKPPRPIPRSAPADTVSMSNMMLQTSSAPSTFVQPGMLMGPMDVDRYGRVDYMEAIG